MAAPVIVREVPVERSFAGSYSIQEVPVYDPKARAFGIRVEHDVMDERFRQLVTLVIRDRGFVAHEMKHTLSVLVARRLGDLTPLPDFAGKFIGGFRADDADWMVFEVLEKNKVEDVPKPLETMVKPGGVDDPWPL